MNREKKASAAAGKTRRVMDTALGLMPADLAIINAEILNVFTGELLSGHGLCVKEEKIAYVGPDAKELTDGNTRIIDAEGMTVIPGFIDGHTHLAGRYLPEEFLKYAMTGGTTAIVTEVFETYFTGGTEGVFEYLEGPADKNLCRGPCHGLHKQPVSRHRYEGSG